jgi:hypothetical protein
MDGSSLREVTDMRLRVAVVAVLMAIWPLAAVASQPSSSPDEDDSPRSARPRALDLGLSASLGPWHGVGAGMLLERAASVMVGVAIRHWRDERGKAWAAFVEVRADGVTHTLPFAVHAGLTLRFVDWPEEV